MNQIEYKKQQMMNSTMLTNESGRSMVEMLGVLAIIGVLSVAGIAGYTTAMNSYRANEAVNQALRLATIISGQRLLNSNATLNATDLTGTNFTMADDSSKIVLTLTGVSDEVANRINAMGLKNANIAEGSSAGTLVFTFANDLGTTGTDSDAGSNTLADQIAAVLDNGGCDGDCPEGTTYISCDDGFCSFGCDGDCSEEQIEAFSEVAKTKYGYGCAQNDSTYLDCGECSESFPGYC